ncbi:hypothetical protein V7S43_000533 [Phytophthora oleae]|uniref:Uncharacterized protein n=1 Tax=Phytophthora oleae TaxID=2107226 RepID=A0ABD3G7D3_9STRA
MSEFAEDERYTRQLHGVSFVNKDEIDGEEESEWFDIGFVEAETESMRQEAEIRLRTQSNNLKRFHDKICMRVTARERQNRLEAQRAQKHLVCCFNFFFYQFLSLIIIAPCRMKSVQRFFRPQRRHRTLETL